MVVPLIIVAVILFIGAVALACISGEEKSIIMLGIAVVVALIGVAIMYTGIHNQNKHMLAKHNAMVHDLQTAGFPVASADVTTTGNSFTSTEVDLRIGRCVFPFVITKQNGVWRITVVRDGNTVALTTSDVANLAGSCPA